METQKTLSFVGPGIPKSDTCEALARLASAHEVCEWFRRDKIEQVAAIKAMLEQDSRLTTANQIEVPKP